MVVTIYLDILFAANCILSMSLAVWLGITKRKRNVFQMCLAGVYGGSILTVQFILAQEGIRNAFGTFGNMVLQLFGYWAMMCGTRRILRLGKENALQDYLQYIGATALYAGILSVGARQPDTNIICFGGSIQLTFRELCIKSLLFVILSPVYQILWEWHQGRKRQYYEIILEKDGIQKSGIGFLDTGNGLHPPGTLEPVIVVEHHFLKTFFEVEEYEKQEKLLDYSVQSWQEICLEKIVWIPYHSIGKEQGVLPGIYFDHLRIKTGRKIVDVPHILVAFCREKVSAQQDYQVLLHSGCMQ